MGEILFADRAVDRVPAVQVLRHGTVAPATKRDFERLEELHGGVGRRLPH